VSVRRRTEIDDARYLQGQRKEGAGLDHDGTAPLFISNLPFWMQQNNRG
jgi:hypothetical protein